MIFDRQVKFEEKIEMERSSDIQLFESSNKQGGAAGKHELTAGISRLI